MFKNLDLSFAARLSCLFTAKELKGLESKYDETPHWARGDFQSLASHGLHLFVTDGKKKVLNSPTGRLQHGDRLSPASFCLIAPAAQHLLQPADAGAGLLLEAKWVPKISFLKRMSLLLLFHRCMLIK